MSIVLKLDLSRISPRLRTAAENAVRDILLKANLQRVSAYDLVLGVQAAIGALHAGYIVAIADEFVAEDYGTGNREIGYAWNTPSP